MWQNLLTFKLLYLRENNAFSENCFLVQDIHLLLKKKNVFFWDSPNLPRNGTQTSSRNFWRKIDKNTQKFFWVLSQIKILFLPPINKNHIFVEKLLTIFCILPLVASTFFVKAVSCQEFLPNKWKFSFDFVWKTNKKFVLTSSFLKNIFFSLHDR